MSDEQHNPDFHDRYAPATQDWHLKKEINVTIIISVIGIAVALLTGYSDLKRDIALIQADNVTLHANDVQQAKDNDSALRLIRAQYEKLDAKLDRLIERAR